MVLCFPASCCTRLPATHCIGLCFLKLCLLSLHKILAYAMLPILFSWLMLPLLLYLSSVMTFSKEHHWLPRRFLISMIRPIPSRIALNTFILKLLLVLISLFLCVINMYLPYQTVGFLRLCTTSVSIHYHCHSIWVNLLNEWSEQIHTWVFNIILRFENDSWWSNQYENSTLKFWYILIIYWKLNDLQV